ncbi:3-oxoacyl-ACP synthase III family protein [Mycobacterium gallinarum]|uniref:3-oxoacyl-ACP synthase III family protein n=1 Tax=Mycobacterium gallinarum TaxID=39689 RepID=UPI0013D57744|nr:3-oxoacyl-[acyl-carrier-protein] synthase III C-terminal domain-containing protein [Mycobacterium gallinarum]
MGTVIDAVGCTHGRWRTRHSALHLAVESAEDCLRHAGRTAREIDLLINAGIYRDRNLAEPALAALIQQDVGANPEEPHENGHGTFSFDVANGSCGLLTALQIADGFLKSHVIRCALVVASDADPGHGMSEQFPFAAAGASLLCTWSDDDRGFGPTYWQNLLDQGESLSATVGLVDHRNVLRFHESPSLEQKFADAASRAVDRCLRDASLTIDDVDAIVATPPRPQYRAALAVRLGVSPERITMAHDERMHTAALASAFSQAATAVGATGSILIVAAGAGVTVGATLYRL